jgi:hypothetical protein
MASEASLRTTVASYRKSAHGCCRWANITDEGLILRTSPPPIAKTGTVVRLPGT